MTILFTDVRNFTGIAEAADPDILMRQTLLPHSAKRSVEMEPSMIPLTLCSRGYRAKDQIVRRATSIVLWATLDEQLLGFPIEPFAGTLADDHHREGQGHHSVVFAEKVPDRLANKNPIRIKPGESADANADRILGVMPGLKGGAFSA